MENYKNSNYSIIRDQILTFLKMQGAQTATAVAQKFGMTTEGARLHLIKLSEEQLVKSESVSKGVGRPITVYRLATKGHDHFPNSHAELLNQFLSSAKKLLGQNSLNLLIEAREKAALKKYSHEMKDLQNVEEKLNRLAEIRAGEGYMAEWRKEGDSYLLIENHCPICTAATECPEFCQSELNNFRQILGKDMRVERDDHIIRGSRRCTYRITTTEK